MHMKQIDKLIIRSFLKSFFAILFITIFTLLVQIFYANLQIIIGKNLGIKVYLRLLYYMGVVSIPLATPIAILIATVLNFASLSENFELVALKNLGVSFLKILRPLLVSVGILCGGLFFMTNHYIPETRKNMRNMLFNLEQVNPLNSLREGFFFEDIPEYSIYIGKKDKEKGLFNNVIVYHNDKNDLYTIVAENAKLYNSQDKKSIIFEVNKGNNYVEMPPTKLKNKNNNINDFMRMNFSVQKIFIDSSNFSFSNTLTSSSSRLNMKGSFSIFKKILNQKKKYDEQKKVVLEKIYNHYGLNKVQEIFNESAETENVENIEYLLDKIQDYEEVKINEEIKNNKQDLKYKLSRDLRVLKSYKTKMQGMIFEILQRMMVVFACILMVILGACLGSLIQKGELGFAMVLAAIFVAIYNVCVILFEKMFDADLVNMFWGSTGALLILLPFTIFFYIQAKNDSQIFKGEFFLRNIRKKKK